MFYAISSEVHSFGVWGPYIIAQSLWRNKFDQSGQLGGE